jgi:hypothetical protein
LATSGKGPSSSPTISLHPFPIHAGLVKLLSLYQGRIDEVFRQKPDLHLMGAEDVADQKIIRSIIARRGHLPGRLSHFSDNDFMRFQQPRELHWHLFTPPRRTFEASHLGHIVRHCHTNASEGLNPFSEHIDEGDLLPIVFIE